jgi:hypothetical protein
MYLATNRGLGGFCLNPTFPWIGQTVDSAPGVCSGVVSVPSPFNEILTVAVPVLVLLMLMRRR